MRKKDLECACLRRIIEQKEREFLQKELELRQQGAKANEKAREADKEYFDEKVKLMEDYHSKKVGFDDHECFLRLTLYFLSCTA